uniref:hypothetical protein n=1 Tax=Fusobacterium gonidiaformans TaxID=849 RepID=UPI0023F23C1E
EGLIAPVRTTRFTGGTDFTFKFYNLCEVLVFDKHTVSVFGESIVVVPDACWLVFYSFMDSVDCFLFDFSCEFGP